MPDPDALWTQPEPPRARQARLAFRAILVLLCTGFLAHAVLCPSWQLTRRHVTWQEHAPWWSPPSPRLTAPEDFERAIDWPLTLGRLGSAVGGIALIWWLTRDDRTIRGV